GRGVATPRPPVEGAAMVLEGGGGPAEAARLRAAAAVTLRDGPRTPDLGGRATTAAVTEAVLERL
ncbi:MAG TPA: NAD-dependent isocitrate dehydrogenase, partial [Chloroflexaceae bacterium]|nr:NAD-dependent isocitrate dehydrogenase [Chloroflexaceae bacterium]